MPANNRKAISSISDLFQSNHRTLVQVCMDEDTMLRARAIQQTLGHKTLGRVWRYCVTAGLTDLEKVLKKGRRMP